MTDQEAATGTAVAPRDRFRLGGVFAFLLGLGLMLPRSFLFTAVPFFRQQVSGDRINCSGVSLTTECSYEYENLRAVIGDAVVMLVGATQIVPTMCAFFDYRLPTSNGMTAVMGLIVNLLVYVGLILMAVFGLTGPVFFSVIVVFCVLMGVFSSFTQMAFFAVFRKLPPQYMVTVALGQGLAGLLGAVVSIVSIAAGTSLKTKTMWYFGMATVGVVITLKVFMMFQNLKFYKELKKLHKTGSNRPSTDDESTVGQHQPRTRWEILKAVRICSGSTALSLFVTVAGYPSLSSSIVSGFENPEWNKYFTAVVCFLNYNVCDWIGRALVLRWMWPKGDSRLLPCLSALRICIIPLIMLCNIYPREHLPVVFSHDAIPVVLIAIHGFVGGYLHCLCYKSYNNYVIGPTESKMATDIMVLSNFIGLFFGSIFAFLLGVAI